jgi:hypothetical protein
MTPGAGIATERRAAARDVWLASVIKDPRPFDVSSGSPVSPGSVMRTSS